MTDADPVVAARTRVVLGVGGGIAAYKAAELTRLFVKAGSEVVSGAHAGSRVKARMSPWVMSRRVSSSPVRNLCLAEDGLTPNWKTTPSR